MPLSQLPSSWRWMTSRRVMTQQRPIHLTVMRSPCCMENVMTGRHRGYGKASAQTQLPLVCSPKKMLSFLFLQVVWQIFHLDFLSKWKNGYKCWTFLGWCTNCRTYVGGITYVKMSYHSSNISKFAVISAALFCLCSMSLRQISSILATQRRDTVKGMWTKPCLIPLDFSGNFQRR